MTMQTLIQGHWEKKAVSYATTGTTSPTIDVPADCYVDKVVLVITTPFSGGVPSIDIGDGDNDDGWIDTTDITEGTAGAYVGDETSTAAYCLGKYYDAADTIDFKETGGACTAGAGYLLAYLIPMDEA